MPRPGGAKARQYRAVGRAYGQPSAPFRGIDELGPVLGMTSVLLERLRPHLSASPAIRSSRALAAAAPAGGPSTGGDLGSIAVARITTKGRGPDNVALSLYAVVRLNATPESLPFEIMSFRRLGE